MKEGREQKRIDGLDTKTNTEKESLNLSSNYWTGPKLPFFHAKNVKSHLFRPENDSYKSLSILILIYFYNQYFFPLLLLRSFIWESIM